MREKKKYNLFVIIRTNTFIGGTYTNMFPQQNSDKAVTGFVQAMEFWKNYGILKRKFHIWKNYGI